MRLLFALLLLSAATLAYELALMRAFSIALGHHVAYMVISIALLGFGASGTLLALWKPKDAERAFALFSFLFALSLPLCFLAAQRLAFEPLLLLWDLKQSLVLAAYYMIFFLPFFFAAVAVALLLLERARQAPRVYFFNLVGSGLGALLLVVFLALVPPARAILLVYVLAATAALLSLQTFKPRTRAGLLLVLVGGFYALHASDVLHIRLSPYKALSTNLNLPEAEVVARRFSPLGRVEVLRSPAFRHAPGLSLVAPATPAPQLGLFLDAESAGALTRFDGRREPLAFLDWTSTAAPYHLLSEPEAARVLLLGTGGGSDVLLAFYHSTGRIEAVELNPQTIALVEETFGEFTGRPYALPNVRPHIAEARGFLESLPPEEKFDRIQISLLDSLTTATAGVHALNENFLYTVEAFNTSIEHLQPQGVLAITRWLRMPPRDTPKLFATAVAALEEQGVPQPGRHLALVRSWATATLLVKRTPFTPKEIAALQGFCEERLFDLDYYPGIEPGQANRFNRLSRSYYFEAARAVLAGGERRAAFLRDYPFNVRPARDDRPYFGHFFRWEALPVLPRTYGRQWLPFFEWGYLTLVATLVQAAVISFVLILLPLLLARR
ncbi:MAG: SAM-dependent methyltransferase, partial [Terriglobia bacterium]